MRRLDDDRAAELVVEAGPQVAAGPGLQRAEEVGRIVFVRRLQHQLPQGYLLDIPISHDSCCPSRGSLGARAAFA